MQPWGTATIQTPAILKVSQNPGSDKIGEIKINQCNLKKNPKSNIRYPTFQSYPDINIPFIKDISNQPANHHKADGKQ